ncbi:hypothetical protein [Demequina salsinemoris]|uniref:hypothetical protein n=1 Tax=Demequina salsinemoris TaxID=577470 RepID=UPI00128DCBD8|nr:hypothetical protein [Demequina salsinemoris]
MKFFHSTTPRSLGTAGFLYLWTHDLLTAVVLFLLAVGAEPLRYYLMGVADDLRLRFAGASKKERRESALKMSGNRHSPP